MKKLYFIALASLCLFCNNISAQKKMPANGSVTICLNNAENNNRQIDTAYIIFDRCDLTGAGIVLDKYDVSNNTIVIDQLPEGKYFADVYIKGIYNQHFSKVITIKEKKNTYTFKLSKADPFLKEDVIIPDESNDFSKTSVALMK